MTLSEYYSKFFTGDPVKTNSKQEGDEKTSGADKKEGAIAPPNGDISLEPLITMKVEENEENGTGDTIKDNHKDQPELANPLEPDCQVHENGTDQDTTGPEQANEERIAEVEQNEDNLQSDNKRNEQEIDSIDELQHESEHGDIKQQVKLEEPTENGPPRISHDNALQTTAIDKYETQKLLEDEQSPVQKEE